MIKYLVAFIVFLSFAHGSEVFKEGYKAGIESCSSEILISCSVDFTRGMFKVSEHGEGFSRGMALKNLINKCESSSISSKECVKAVRNNEAVCKEL
ncbi:MAG: hypothetical protein CME64_01165 [Halobacteriovoraceae bacterium]|nr:hypothetical protein [Halobacteriovoraceae bacterium]